MTRAQQVSPGTRRATPHGEITFRSLVPFFALAFGLGWGLAALPLLFPDQIQSAFGPIGGTAVGPPSLTRGG
jgi:hypothetical protein